VPPGAQGSFRNTGPVDRTLARYGAEVRTLVGWLGIIADRFMRLLNRIPNIPGPP